MEMFIRGDCRVEMPHLAAQSIRLAITSPPYNAGKAYENALSLDGYRAFAASWTACLPRVLTADGALWLNLGYMKLSDSETLPLTYVYYPLLKQLGLHLVQEVIWHFEGGMAYKKRFSHRTERWQWWVCNPDDYMFHLDAVRDASLNRTKDKRNHHLGKNPTDLWFFNRVVGGAGAVRDKTLHPCQFPVPMIRRIIRACSDQDDTILDCFGGSGSTACAAYEERRGYLSIEADAAYHEAAKRRVEQTDRWKVTAVEQLAVS